jgi:hypothetical protein
MGTKEPEDEPETVTSCVKDKMCFQYDNMVKNGQIS